MAAESNADGANQLSAETISFLEEAKKGKARRFVMICKGPNIISLVVFKKGSYEKYKKEAKQSGKGQFYFGIITGKGANLIFQLAIADGFDSPPTKTNTLRSFLDEQADLKTKSEYEIVQQLGPLWDEANPLVARFIALENSVAQVISLQPALGAELNAVCDSIRELLEGDQSDSAEELIAKLEARLKAVALQLAGDKASNSTTETNTANGPQLSSQSTPSVESSPSLNSDMATFTGKLKALKPRIDAALSQNVTDSNRLKDLIARIGPLAKAKQFQEGIALLDEIEQVLNDLSQVSSVPPTKTIEPGVLFTTKLKQLKPDLDRALSMSTPGAVELRKRLAEMTELARAKDFVQANTLLIGIADLVSRLLATSSRGGDGQQATQQEPSDKIRYMQARVLYQNALSQAKLDLERLMEAARAAFADQPDFAAISAAIGELSSALSGFDLRLVDSLDAAYNTSDSAAVKQHHQTALNLIGEYQTFFEQQGPLLQRLDSNPFIPVQIESRLRSTLTDLAMQLA